MNSEFLHTVCLSFLKFLDTHANSTEKLKILHGRIAKDLQSLLGDGYDIMSYGHKDGKEGTIQGRYYDKNVDILIEKDGEVLAGFGVKFVMNNYSQNSNNYFENMLGETANLRANRIQYFQIIVLPEQMPYYKDEGLIRKWETLTQNNLNKYLNLSKDNPKQFFHTPDKILLCVVQLPKIDTTKITDKKAYKDHYATKREHMIVRYSPTQFGDFQPSVILNDYERFLEKAVYAIKSI